MAKEGRGIIKFELNPIILTFQTPSDVKSAIKDATTGRAKMKGVKKQQIQYWLDDKEKPTFGTALVKIEGGNRAALVIFADTTDLKNGELFEQTEGKFAPAPLRDVGTFANALDVTKGVDEWSKIQELMIKGGLEIGEVGENNLGILFKTYHSGKDPPKIIKGMQEGLLAWWNKKFKGAKLESALHLSGIPVWILITSFSEKNYYLVTILFDPSNLSDAKKFKEQKKIGLTSIPVKPIGWMVTWREIVGNVSNIFNKKFDNEQLKLAKNIKKTIKGIDDEEDRIKYAIEALSEGKALEL